MESRSELRVFPTVKITKIYKADVEIIGKYPVSMNIFIKTPINFEARNQFKIYMPTFSVNQVNSVTIWEHVSFIIIIMNIHKLT